MEHTEPLLCCFPLAQSAVQLWLDLDTTCTKQNIANHAITAHMPITETIRAAQNCYLPSSACVSWLSRHKLVQSASMAKQISEHTAGLVNPAHLCQYRFLCLGLNSQQHTVFFVPKAVVVRCDGLVHLKAGPRNLQAMKQAW